MTKLFLFFTLLLLSCSFGARPPKKPIDNSVPVVTEPTPSQPSLPGEGAGQPVLEPIPVEVVVPVPVEPESKLVSIKTNIKYYGSAATASRKAKYERAMALFRKVVGLKEYRSAILAHKKRDGSSGFNSKSGDPYKSPEDIYKHILAGNEKLQPEKDGEVDMEVEFYYASNSTVGYTYPNVKRIYVNTKFFDGYTISSVAANLNHEWMHKLGYGHDSAATSIRPYSTPYGVGSIMRTIGKKYEKEFP